MAVIFAKMYLIAGAKSGCGSIGRRICSFSCESEPTTYCFFTQVSAKPARSVVVYTDKRCIDHLVGWVPPMPPRSAAFLLAAALLLSQSPLFARSPTPPDPPGRVDNLSACVETPTVYAQNREPTHAPRTIPYPSVAAARVANEPGTELEARWSESPYFQLLNGTWAFVFHERPAAVPLDCDETRWETIRVPKSWQTAGYD